MENKIRVSQFMPFDSLKGFREALEEKERIVVDKIDLSSDQEEEIDLKLHQIKLFDQIEIIYLDKKEYVKVMGIISKIDYENKYLSIVKKKILFNNIVSINNLD